MDIRNIEEIPSMYKELIEKSCLIFDKIDHSRFGAKKINDFEMITIVSNTNMTKVKTIYVSKSSNKLKEIITLKPNIYRFIKLSDAVIDDKNKIVKNRWGIEYSDVKYAVLMDSMSYAEIVDFFDNMKKLP